MSTPVPPTDLTKRPPRSPRVRLGGMVLLPRMLDKGRADIAGTIGEYHYDCPMDQHVVTFLGLDAKALRVELAKGKSDSEILAWILANANTPRAPWEIAAWNAYHEKRGPDSDAETLAFFADMVGKLSKTREDLNTWFDALDADDYATFGGKV